MTWIASIMILVVAIVAAVITISGQPPAGNADHCARYADANMRQFEITLSALHKGERTTARQLQDQVEKLCRTDGLTEDEAFRSVFGIISGNFNPVRR